MAHKKRSEEDLKRYRHELYEKNRERIMAYQSEYRKRLIEEARNRKRYDSLEEMLDDWNHQLLKAVQSHKFTGDEEWLNNALLQQVKFNNNFFNFFLNGQTSKED